MGPLELFIAWQSLVLAVLVTSATGGIKKILDITLWKGSKEARKQNRWVSEIIVPAIPFALGAGVALVLPFRPEAVDGYIAEHATGAWRWVGYAGWGLVVGGFGGDWLYQRTKSFLKGKAEG